MSDEKSSAFLHGGMSTTAQIQEEYYDKGKIYTLQIEATMKCLQGCSYCYANSTPKRETGLSSKQIKDVLDDAANIGVKNIDWLGGDPLERDDWYELMVYAQTRGLVNNIWTSGLPLADMKIARKALEVTDNGGFISTHLDSLNPEVYRQVHNYASKTFINQILTGIDNVLSMGKNPDEMWNCITLTKQVAEEDCFTTMSYFWKGKGIRTVLTLFNPANGSKVGSKFIPTQSMIQQAFKWRDEICYDDSKYSFSTMDTNKFYCATMITITSEGTYTPCSVIRSNDFGSLSSHSLAEVQSDNPGDILLLKLRTKENLPEKCQTCENNNVCFGCRSSAYYYNGDVFGADPMCPKTFDIILDVSN